MLYKLFLFPLPEQPIAKVIRPPENKRPGRSALLAPAGDKKKTAQRAVLPFFAPKNYAFTLPFTFAITSSAMLLGAGA